MTVALYWKNHKEREVPAYDDLTLQTDLRYEKETQFLLQFSIHTPFQCCFLFYFILFVGISSFFLFIIIIITFFP